MATIEDIKNLDGYQFETLMDRILEHGYENIYYAVTGLILDYWDSIHECWDDDPDDVWDAEYDLIDICNKNDEFKTFVENILDTL